MTVCLSVRLSVVYLSVVCLSAEMPSTTVQTVPLVSLSLSLSLSLCVCVCVRGGGGGLACVCACMPPIKTSHL